MNKRGVSEVIVSVLLILLVITAVAILWAPVKNFISYSMEKSEIKPAILTTDLELSQIQQQLHRKGLTENLG